MGGVFSKPKVPDPPPPPPAPEPIPEAKEPKVRNAREQIRRQAAVARGREDDVKTSPLGLPSRLAAGRSSLLGR